MRTSVRVFVSIGALLWVAMLGGCTGSAEFSIFERPRADEDLLPASSSAFLDADEFDLESARLSASDDGIDYFIIKQRTGSPCLLVVGPSPTSVCGGLPVSFEPESGNAVQLVAAPAKDGDGWTAISDNIRIKPADQQ